ncbi:MAG: HAD family phosphatase [Simkaniaceae bacterium]|nr:HAD family phosphatase [Simkaniaceae bacterium]
MVTSVTSPAVAGGVLRVDTTSPSMEETAGRVCAGCTQSFEEGGSASGRESDMDLFFGAEVLFFDLDGLLVDTEKLHFQAYSDVLPNYGVTVDWDFATFARSAHQSQARLRSFIASHAEEPMTDARWQKLYADKSAKYTQLLSNAPLSLMPSVEPLLRRREKSAIPCAVVTNSSRAWTDTIRDRFSILNTIPIWVTREEYKEAKPAPDGYLKGIDILQAEGKRKVGFEDTMRGIRALEGAGISPVLICSPEHPQLEEKGFTAIPYYPSFTDLLSHRSR